jgi:Domain of unknown function (DUF5753)
MSTAQGQRPRGRCFRGTRQIIDDPDDIATMTVMWETLKAEALSRAASQELIKEVAKSWT